MTTKKVVAKKKVAKPRIGLDPKGIDKLEKVMLANGKYFYNQRVFGQICGLLDEYGETASKPLSIHACETGLCAAGFARLLAVGKEKLYREVKRHTLDFSDAYAKRCKIDGERLLGIRSKVANPWFPIFGYPEDWPHDLADKFEALDGKPMAQVRQYIRMLRTRANSDGSLTEKGQKRY